MEVKFIDNSQKILDEFHTKAGAALNLIGDQATRHTQDGTPVRTGKLKNSATWEVAGDEKSVEVGFIDVDYAKYVEFGTSRQRAWHMLQNAITKYPDEYKSILQHALK